MTEPQFFISKVTNGFYLIVFQNKEAVWAQEVVREQEGVVRSEEKLLVALKEALAEGV